VVQYPPVQTKVLKATEENMLADGVRKYESQLRTVALKNLFGLARPTSASFSSTEMDSPTLDPNL